MMYYRVVPDISCFRLHGSPDPREDLKIKGRMVSQSAIEGGVDDGTDEELQTFFLAIQVLLAGERQQRSTVELLTATSTRNIKTDVKSAADYLEIYRYPVIVRNRKKRAERKEDEMTKYDELTELLCTVFAPIKEKLRLPVVNKSAYSFTVPDSLVIAITKNECKNYLKSLLTYGTITEYVFDKIVEKVKREYPDNAEKIITEIEKTRTHDHLSAISFNDSGGQLVVSIVNVHGDQLQLEGYKFLRLIEEHDNEKGGWLSLGFLERKETWLPEPLLKFNKEKSGELVARYSAQDSCLDVKCRGGASNSGISAQARFIIEQDYLVCLYVAILKLKNDKQRFEGLRELAETKEVTNMAGLEEDLFN